MNPNKQLVHNKLKDLRSWVEVDVANTSVQEKLFIMIDSDNEKDSPAILKGISESKYSPYEKYLSNMGKSQLYCLKMEKKLRTSAYVLLAAVKFKNKLKKFKLKTE
jgi:hypothetical protein